MANYLHGVETRVLNIGPRPIQAVKSAVIGLVGIAPKGPRETITLVQSSGDAAQFGARIPGFTIPQALAAIQAQGAGLVMVVNVFDPVANTVAEQDTLTVTNGRCKTTYGPIVDNTTSPALAVVVQGGSPLTAYTEGTDYTIDEFGRIQMIAGGAISEGDVLTVDYHRLDASTVANSQIIGAINQGVRTGFKVFELAFNSFGVTPRILIAPGFSTTNAIAAELIVQAERYRGHALIDAPVGITPSAAIIGRGPLGTINFGTSSKRAYLLYPHLKWYDPFTETDVLAPYSQFMAGVIAATDNTDGYWFSPSNREIKGITGVERQISAAVNDASTEANLLNEKGITTVFNSFGTGLRTWGNRSAAFPTETAPANFIPVQRTADILHESVELAMLQFIDKPITNALIDAIRDSVNAFINTLLQRGALIDGVCTYDPAKNPPTQIAAGQLVFDITFMPPTPAERITFESFIDINLLRNLGA